MSTGAENRGQKRPPPPFGDDDDGGGKRPAAEAGPSAAAVDEEESDMCWLCFGEGPDESGQPLVRDCSCRGGSGWAHLSCIVDYAKQKTEQWDGGLHIGQLLDPWRDMRKFNEPWRECPSCKQNYQNELAVDLANEFVPFVEEKYPDDKSKHLEALNSKLFALLPKQKEEKQQKEEAIQIANKILSVVGQMKTADPSLPTSIQYLEANAYNNLGAIALNEGTKEGAKAAIGYYENCRDIFKVLDNINVTGIVSSMESLIEQSKFMVTIYEGSGAMNKEELLEKDLKGDLNCYKQVVADEFKKSLDELQEVYEKLLKLVGGEHIATINAGVSLANGLKAANRGIEVEMLLTKLAVVSKRVHGPDHDTTKSVEADLQKVKVRTVGIKTRDEDECFQALRYEEDGGKCVVQGPLAKPRSPQEEKTFTVATEDLIYYAGTPVVCRGLEGSSSHLNGKVGDVQPWRDGRKDSYEVHFEENDLEPCALKPENIRILFDLPGE